MTFELCLKTQARLHPSMLPKDAVKLCYQAAFGAEHLLSAGAEEYFRNEFSAAAGTGDLFEVISPDFCRINLAPWKAKGLPGGWLFQMFRKTAETPGRDGGLFHHYTQCVRRMAASGELPFTLDDWLAFTEPIQTPAPVHHSDHYRNAEAPAYRVVSAELMPLLPLLEHLSRLPRKAANIIAIDGRAAAGKTTLACMLRGLIGGGIVHMDDFFLPGALRTEARLSRPGGNIHHERFLTDAAPYLPNSAPFAYQVFNCAKMRLDGYRQVPESPWRIVEGSYSFHPAFGDYMDLRIFCDVSPEEQIQRIRKRDGSMAAEFSSRWIPMEELYFDTYNIRKGAVVYKPTAAFPT